MSHKRGVAFQASSCNLLFIFTSCSSNCDCCHDVTITHIFPPRGTVSWAPLLFSLIRTRCSNRLS